MGFGGLGWLEKLGIKLFQFQTKGEAEFGNTDPGLLTHNSVRVPGLPDGEHPPVSLVLHGGHLHGSHQGGHGHSVVRPCGHR